MTLGPYALLSFVGLWLCEELDWNFDVMLPAFAIPHWFVVTVIWRKWGPYMPGL